MLRNTFENSYREPITGQQIGIHRTPLRWISQLGLTDHEGTPFKMEHLGELYPKYGADAVQDGNNQITMQSDSGDHEYDQAAMYLGQNAIQQGKSWFPKVGPSVPPELAVQAAHMLRQKLEGHNSNWSPKVAWVTLADLYDGGTEPSWMGDDSPTCPKCGLRECNHQIMDGINFQPHGDWEIDNHGVGLGN